MAALVGSAATASAWRWCSNALAASAGSRVSWAIRTAPALPAGWRYHTGARMRPTLPAPWPACCALAAILSMRRPDPQGRRFRHLAADAGHIQPAALDPVLAG